MDPCGPISVGEGPCPAGRAHECVEGTQERALPAHRPHCEVERLAGCSDQARRGAAGGL